MKKQVGFISIVLVLVMLLGGCVGKTVCDTVPEGDSLICKVIPNPETADVVLQLANIEALKADVYKAKQARDFLNEVLVLVDSVETYQDLTTYIIGRIDNLGPELFVVSGYVSQFNRDLPITKTDRGFLKYHLERQLKIIDLVAGQ